MPDLYPNDAAESEAPLPPETMIVEARLRSPEAAPADTRPMGSGRFALSAGGVVVVLTVAYIVSKLFGN